MVLNSEIAQILRENSKNVTIIAASKTRTIDEINNAKKWGLKHFGENYVQEALDKKTAFQDVTLHMIGKLQSNKAKQAVELFNVIHTMTSDKLAAKLNKHCEVLNKTLDVFIQVNIAEEPQKNGIPLKEADGLVKNIQNYPFLNLLGFMVVPPKGQNPEPFFQKAQELTQKYGFKCLSMGMTGDYKTAIKNGSTHIRIGRAIWGERR
jgi:pyridoxal phosphate enzyme (YggS family)